MDIKNKELIREVIKAAEECAHPLEEEGGIILARDGEYLFAKVKNIHTGTGQAAGLYETDQDELREKVLNRVAEGWKMYASFHTHPSFSPSPSALDLSKLFQGFKYNIISSPKTYMFSFNEWVGERTITYYIPTDTLNHLLKTDAY
jgi:proteasome lid subunit RPN8/RPN11